MNCEIKDCTEKAEYPIYRHNEYDDNKVWLWVCKKCEQKIGDENEVRNVSTD